MIKVKFGSDLSKDGDFFRFVDFVTDTIDLVFNPQGELVDSDVVRAELNRCGCEGPWTMMDGDVLNQDAPVQYVTVALENAEDYVKLRLLADELITKNQYSKEDLLC
jgi:hypothetical protein